MRLLYPYLFFPLLFCTIPHLLPAQCPTTTVELATQSDVDAFVAQYNSCSQLPVTLRIDAASTTTDHIVDLSGLSFLTEIDGDLIFLFTEELSSNQGLENLEYVSGKIDFDYNEQLTDISGFASLDSVGGSLTFSTTPLATLNGLEQLVYVGGTLSINSNTLTDISSLSNLTTVGNSLQLSGNPGVTNLNGLQNLTAIGANVVRNPYVVVFPKPGSLSILFTALTSLDGFSSLTSIEGGIYIRNNGDLTDIDGLNSIDYSQPQDLEIENNPNLFLCSVAWVCAYLDTPNSPTNAPADIENNGIGCMTRAEVEQGCGNNGPSCPTTDVLLDSQADINLFPLLYPTCTNFDYNLSIVENPSTPITDLSPLNGLDVIVGDFVVRNTSLTDFGSFQPDSLGGDVYIDLNNNLVSTFDSIKVGTSSDIYIRGNTLLTSLPAISSRFVFGMEFFGRLIITDNTNLQSLPDLSAIDRISGLQIENNASLTDLSGLEAVSVIGTTVEIRDNPSLMSLDGLQGVTSLGAGFSDAAFTLVNNDALTDITAAGNIVADGQDVTLFENDQLAYCANDFICGLTPGAGFNAPGCNTWQEVAADCQAAVLPVQLEAFTAERRGADVQLDWLTSSETGASHYEVERSTDARYWISVATVAAAGTSDQRHSYRSTDMAAPTDLLYYRLAQIDLDGTVEYGPVRTVAATRTTPVFQVYPNPTEGVMTISPTSDTADPIRVFNAQGQFLRTLPAGQSRLDLSDQPAGLYQLVRAGEVLTVVLR